MGRELTEKQLWLLRMIFEEEITPNEIQRYAEDNAANIPRWRETNKRRSGLPSRLDRQIGDGEIKAEPAVLQCAEGEPPNEPFRSRRSKRKS